MTKAQAIKKPTLQVQEQQPRNIQRADIAPADGFALVVDGHFKTQFDDEAASQKAAKELLEKYAMLQVEIYDASTKMRTLVRRQADKTPRLSND
jgi:recombinational DNA repair protein RecT